MIDSFDNCLHLLKEHNETLATPMIERLLNTHTLPPYQEAILYVYLGKIAFSKHMHAIALNAFQKAVHTCPEAPAIHYQIGLSCLQHHQLIIAEKSFLNVLSLSIDDPTPYFQLGLIYLLQEDYEKAKKMFLTFQITHPDDADTWVNLGIIALRNDEPQQAIDYFSKGLSFNENHIEARHNLASLFIHHRRYENACIHYNTLLETNPDNTEWRYNLGVSEMSLGQLEKAKQAFLTVLRYHPTHRDSCINLSAIHLKQNNKKDALHYLKQTYQANKNDALVAYMLKGLNEDKADTCEEYVKNVFDNYALYYEKHLASLAYQLPTFFQQYLQADALQFSHTLDIGCGTGLTGLVLSSLTSQLTGIDLSEDMLKEAEKKHCYETLIHSNAIDFLTLTHECYDSMVLMDVLPYIGDVSPLLALCAKRLTLKAHLFFSIELSHLKPYQLTSTLRFKHHPDYIKTILNQLNLEIYYQTTVVGRQENNADVLMMFYHVKRYSQDA